MKTLQLSKLLTELSPHQVAPFFGETVSPDGPEFNDVAVYDIRHVGTTTTGDNVYGGNMEKNGDITRVHILIALSYKTLESAPLDQYTGFNDATVKGLINQP